MALASPNELGFATEKPRVLSDEPRAAIKRLAPTKTRAAGSRVVR